MGQPELFAVSQYETPQDVLKTLSKTSPSELESYLHGRGFLRVAGVDEAGRGPIAGPVVACACVLPKGAVFQNLKDSKQLSSKEIEVLYQELLSCPGVDYSVAIVGPEVIDRINILQATLDAMRIALEHLKVLPEMALVDGKQVPRSRCRCIPVVKGDAHCPSISAASVIAKYTRDELMREYDSSWPQYGFAKHKGYGTEFHLSQLEVYGPCPIHRLSFAPLNKSKNPIFTQLELFEAVQ
jgi:ribonuclease HII